MKRVFGVWVFLLLAIMPNISHGFVLSGVLAKSEVIPVYAPIWGGLTNTINDDFNRADLGSNWVNASGGGYSDLIIESNAIVSPSGVYAGMSWVNNPSADQYAQIDVNSLPPLGGNVLVMVRANLTQNTAYMGSLTYNGEFNVTLIKYIGGSQFAFSSKSPSSPVVMGSILPLKMRIGIKGTSISLQTYDGLAWTDQIIATDPTIATGYPALSIQNDSSADNFAAGTL